MPGIIFIGRRWNIASDDLFYPGFIELIIRFIWFCLQLLNYIQNNADFQCSEILLLHVYFIGFLVLITLILVSQFFIVYISTRGTITNTSPRRHMVKFLYMRSLLAIIELIWSIMGVIWLTRIKWVSCSKLVYFSVLANIALCGAAIFFLLFVLFIVFDPISHLPVDDVATKRNILFDWVKRLCCCCYCCLYTGNSRQTNYENSYKQISSILEMIFRNGDMTPSDIAAGIILLSQKELDQFNRESKINKKYEKNRIKKLSKAEIEIIPKWMNVNEAAYYIRYALATYSWPYYLYMHNVRGFCDLCCSPNASTHLCCCCCATRCCGQSEGDETHNVVIADQNAFVNHRHHLKAFKFLSKTNDCDLLHANFHNDLFLSPYCVLVDHFKKSIIITIRGTLSMRDVLTDMSAECDCFDFEDLNEACHNGIYRTADNIFNRLRARDVLEGAFMANPSYQLVITGHSLGAGTAVILALKLRSQYPNLKCIAYSPPGGLMSKNLAEFTKKFTMSIVVGDDIVSRLSLHSIHALKADILREIYHTDLPKYKIIWKYSMSFVKSQEIKTQYMMASSDEDTDNDETNTIQSINHSFTSNNIQISDQEDLIRIECRTQTSINLDSIESYNQNDLSRAAQLAIQDEAVRSKRAAKQYIRSKQSSLMDIADFDKSDNDSPKKSNKSIIAYDLIKRMMNHVKETYPELQLPGNILYIYRIKSGNSRAKSNLCSQLCSKLCCLCSTSKKINYDSRWASSDEFKKIIITNRMLMDHFPNNVEDALSYFNNTSRINI